MKKILLESYLQKNIGDDLFIKMMASRFKNVEFHIYSNREYCNGAFEENIKIRRQLYLYRIIKQLSRLVISRVELLFCKLEAVKYSREFDATITLGGSMYIERMDKDMSYKKRRIYIESFKSKNKPCFIIGANFGPFISEKFYINYKDYFKECYDVSFREEYSKKLFHSTNVRCNPDIIFALDYKCKPKKKQVGFSIIDLKFRNSLKAFEERYQQNLMKLIEKAYVENYEIIFLSFCESEGDLRALELLYNKIPYNIRKDIIIYNYNGDMEKTLEVLSQLEIVVATRFHSMVLSQVFGQGVLPYVYSDKILNVLKDMDFDDLYIDIRDNKLENIDEIWMKIKTNKKDITDLKRDAIKHFIKFEEFINS